MKYHSENVNSQHYVFDEVKMVLKSLGVDVYPVFLRTYLDGHTEELSLEEFESGHRYIPYKDIKDLPVGFIKHGIMKVSENRFKILQIEMF